MGEMKESNWLRRRVDSEDRTEMCPGAVAGKAGRKNCGRDGGGAVGLRVYGIAY